MASTQNKQLGGHHARYHHHFQAFYESTAGEKACIPGASPCKLSKVCSCRGSQQQSVQGLEVGQIRALFDNCLKLASENKITAKNTWDLPLIDHLSDLVQV